MRIKMRGGFAAGMCFSIAVLVLNLALVGPEPGAALMAAAQKLPLTIVLCFAVVCFLAGTKTQEEPARPRVKTEREP